MNGCESQEKNAEKFDETKKEVIRNYVNNSEIFDSLKWVYGLNHIIQFKFLNKDRISLTYYELTGNKGEGVEIENKEINSPEITRALKLDSIEPHRIVQLREMLQKINVSWIAKIDSYDATRGKYIKWYDLRYLDDINGINFYYRVYQEPLDSVEEGSYSSLMPQNLKESILNKHAIWYYQ